LDGVSFVSELSHDLTPADITDGSGKTAVLHHPSDIQVFNTDHTKPFGYRGGDLVLPALTGLGYFPMQPR
jgi:hypothetical protein